MNDTNLVSVVIPVFNEQGNLDELIRRCLETCDRLELPYELILIDDGSQDDSADIISAAAETHPGKVTGVLLNRNYGQHAAVMAGLPMPEGITWSRSTPTCKIRRKK